MKKAKRVIGLLLTAGLLLTGIPASAFQAPANAAPSLKDGYSSSPGQYAVYPVPQSVDYDSDKGVFSLGATVSVVKESGIDEPTSDFLDEILSGYGRTKTESSAIAQAGSQILLGISESGGIVDAWASEHITRKDADLFTKTDSYLLSAKNGTILILGKNTDAVYYGLATLQMMFSSFNGTKFLNVQIEDFATMKMRGFIEGFYGGWNYDGRKSLMRFAKDLKMNTYIYASKTDSYHKNDVLYPEDQLEQIKELVAVGDETKVKYCWSVHISYFFNAVTAAGSPGQTAYENAFEDRYQRLLDKFDQLYGVGVRKFAILNDDFGSGEHSEVVRLLNRLDEDLTAKGCDHLSYCMQGYNKTWGTTNLLDENGNPVKDENGNNIRVANDELKTMKTLSPSIDLFWTGDDVNSPITQETVDFVKENTNHEAIFWLNYPVNEHAKAGVFLGDITHYARDSVTGLAGAVSNPCLFTEANKVGLFQLASLFWNNNNYSEYADTIWEDSFKYLQPEVYEAYLTIARNVSNCPGSSRISAGFPESEYLTDTLNAVHAKLQKGQPIAGDADAQALKKEFDNILASIETFRKDCANDTLVSELDPWLKSLKDTATAGSSALAAIFAIENGNLDESWRSFSIAAQSIATQNTYPGRPGDSSYPIALAGSKRLVPFATDAVAAARNLLIPFLNPTSTEFTPSFYAVIGGTQRKDSAESAKAFDGSEATAAIFNTDQKLNDYIGADLGRTLSVESIEFLQGTNDSDLDYYHNAILEYSTDGENFTELKSYEKDQTPQHILEEDLSIRARFIRLRLTAVGTETKGSYWTHIREININGSNVKESRYGLYASEGVLGTVTKEGLSYRLSQEGEISLAPNEYIGLKLEDISGLNAIDYSAEGALSLTLQYSSNGIIWKNVDSASAVDKEPARYVRLYNDTNAAVSFNLTEFTVTTYANGIHPSVIEYSAEFSTLQEGSWENLFDHNEATYIWTNTTQRNNQYIIVDLGTETPLYDFSITQATGNPKFYNASFYLSADKTNWGNPIASVTKVNGNPTGEYCTEENGYIKIRRTDLDGTPARYFKILITGDEGYYLRINDIAFNETIHSAEEPLGKLRSSTLSGNLNSMADGDISTVYISDTPSDGTASVKYLLSENTKLTSVTFLQSASAITGAEVKAELYDGSSTWEETLGTLSESGSTFYFRGRDDVISLTVTWPEGTTPVLYEIIPVSGETVHTVAYRGEGAPSGILYITENKTLLLPENTFQKEGYTFKGWNDGTKTYAPGTRYLIGTKDVTLTAVWESNKTEEKDPPITDNKPIEENKTYEYGNIIYTVTSAANSTVAFDKPSDSAASQNLTSVNVPDTITLSDGKEYKVTSIKAAAFQNQKITEVTIGKNVQTIERDAFAGCTNLKKLTIRSTELTVIGDQSFANCKKLTKIIINSKKLKRIESRAFAGCKSLKQIIIKSTKLKFVGKNAFKGIHKKATIKVPASKLSKYQKLMSGKGQKKTVKVKK